MLQSEEYFSNRIYYRGYIILDFNMASISESSPEDSDKNC